MDALVKDIVETVISPMLVALCMAFATWAVSKVPGPIKDFLYSAIHQRDVQTLVGAMARRATAEVGDHRTPAPVAADVVRYIETVLPGLLAKMQIPEVALNTMASAAIVTAEKVAAPDAVVVPVVVDPTRP